MDDWFMRQIESFAENAARFILDKPENEQVVELRQYAGDDLVYNRLCMLLARLDFCGAEDLLWAHLRPRSPSDLQLAEDFYKQLGGFGDDILEAHGFSREEVSQGLERAREYLRTTDNTITVE